MKKRPPRLNVLLGALCTIGCSSPAPDAEPVLAGVPARPLGTLTTIEGEPCGDGDRCIRFEVSCSEVAEPARGFVVIDDPLGPVVGTVVSFSGSDGSSFSRRQMPDGLAASLGGPESERFRTFAGRRPAMDDLRAAGYRVVQVVWEDGWTRASPESGEGLGRLACRPATVTNWIHDTLTESDDPLCVIGGSGGAAQVSYLLSHYGLEDRLALVVPFTGYWMGRIDLGCLDDDPLNASLHYGEVARGFIDESLGYPRGEGPCTSRDEGARAVFEESSIALGGTDYVHPNTLVYVVLAGADGAGALVQGHTYAARLLREGSPRVRVEILAGAPHGLGASGPALIRDIVLRECRLRAA